MKTITEETQVNFKEYKDLSYYESGTAFVDLYNNGNYEGQCYVWCDSEMDDREYITLNYEIVYLDTLELINPEDLQDKG